MFEPSSVFLNLGDSKGTFRIGVDSSIFPISYFYTSIKQDEGITYYTITTNNNIKVTNIPVPIIIPGTINVPQGGCSIPYLLNLLNPPFNDVMVTFNYDNSQYN